MTDRVSCRGIGVLFAFLGALAHADNIDVPPDALILKVGQTLVVTFTASGDSLVSPRVLPEPSTTEPSVTFQLSKTGSARTLMVTNAYARPLAYRAVARMRGMGRRFEPHMSAVRGGMQSVVTLGEPFDELSLFEFHLVAAP
jgi:hypothetical protein